MLIQIFKFIYRQILQWLPVVGTTLFTMSHSFIFKRRNIFSTILMTVVLGISSYKQLMQWILKSRLENLILLQKKLHNFCKQGLNIVARIYGNKLKPVIIEKNYE